MIALHGIPAACNYTVGPALIYTSTKSIDAIYHRKEPVVVIASYIPLPDLKKIDMKKVRGFVLEHGSPADPTYATYFLEKRATVMGVGEAVDKFRPEMPVYVDGVEGTVYLEPDEATVAQFDERRQAGSPVLPEKFYEILELVFGSVKGAFSQMSFSPPFDYPGIGRLLPIVATIASGKMPAPDDAVLLREVVIASMRGELVDLTDEAAVAALIANGSAVSAAGPRTIASVSEQAQAEADAKAEAEAAAAAEAAASEAPEEAAPTAAAAAAKTKAESAKEAERRRQIEEAKAEAAEAPAEAATDEVAAETAAAEATPAEAALDAGAEAAAPEEVLEASPEAEAAPEVAPAEGEGAGYDVAPPAEPEQPQ